MSRKEYSITICALWNSNNGNSIRRNRRSSNKMWRPNQLLTGLNVYINSELSISRNDQQIHLRDSPFMLNSSSMIFHFISKFIVGSYL